MLKPSSSPRSFLGFNPNFLQKIRSFCAESSNSDSVLEELKVLALPLTDRPLFPGFKIPIHVKDPKLLRVLLEGQRIFNPYYVGAFLVKDPSTYSNNTEKNVKELKGRDLLNRLHDIGTRAKITSIQDDRVVLCGDMRLRMTQMVTEDPLSVQVNQLKNSAYSEDDDLIKAMSIELKTILFDGLNTGYLWRDRVEYYDKFISSFYPPKLADFAGTICYSSKVDCQRLLEELDVYKRLILSLSLLKKDMEIHEIRQFNASDIEDSSLRHSKAILAFDVKKGFAIDENKFAEDEFHRTVVPIPNRDKIPPHVLQVIDREEKKLQHLQQSSMEYYYIRDYITWLSDIPWNIYSDESFNVQRAEEILDQDHFGLKEVKELILEIVAEGKERGTMQGNIICLVGPPGVGKTTIAYSIARALNRKFTRFSVGGLSDVSIIKGTRRNYAGAMPGKIVHFLTSVGTINPLVLIDEIDKMGSTGHYGDPASALLEVLDPEQNRTFSDHYLDIPFDLSKVLFVCTANSLEKIPGPLFDRLEVINIYGYNSVEKMHIARYYLEKKVRDACILQPEQVELKDSALRSLIEFYCREAGVRNLQRHIQKIYRKIFLELARKGANSSSSSNNVSIVSVDDKNLRDYVGTPFLEDERIYDETPPGVATGLGWTNLGGTILYVEIVRTDDECEGKGGDLVLTGQLGDVMLESGMVAYSAAKHFLAEKDQGNLFFKKSILHMHIPAGATPKDGPSCGSTMITAMLSLALNKAVKKDLAMTGEVTLTGQILRIGGVREKMIAAKRNGLKILVLPLANRDEYDDEIPSTLKEGFDVYFADTYHQIFDLAFEW